MILILIWNISILRSVRLSITTWLSYLWLKSNWFQVDRYFYWLKPVYFENKIFEVSMIDHFMNSAIGNLYLCLNAMVSFFIIIAISESSDGVLPLSFNMLLMCFVCFKLDGYSW